MNNNYCCICGEKLIKKECGIDGYIDYCENCHEYRYNLFNIAVSMIVKCEDEYLLIKQYGRDAFILVAGYINNGESVEEACKRELKEETNLVSKKVKILRSSYYNKSETLMINCLVEVSNKNIKVNDEIDYFEWFNKDDMQKYVKENSLASYFVERYLNDIL